MDPRCFVRVLVEATDATIGEATTGDAGTGYLVSPDRVLTAAHLVPGPGEVTIEHDRADGQGVERVAARRCWPGSELDSEVGSELDMAACDIALLRLDRPVDLEVPPPRLAETAIDTVTPWESRGWARAAADEPLVRDGMVDLHGEAAAFEPRQKRCQLTVAVRPETIEDWRGISGAPVFERGGGRRLLAVVAEAPRRFANVLFASPLVGAMAREGFVEALGAGVARKRRQRLIDDLTKHLKEDRDEAAQIAGADPAWQERCAAGGAPALVAALLDAEVVTVLLALDRAHAERRRDRRSTRVIEAVVARLAPLLVQRGVLHALPEATGGVEMRLPFALRTLGELMLAAFDGRPAHLRPVPGSYPDGEGRLPLPPEAGLDFKGQDALAAYARHIESARLTPEVRDHLDRQRRRRADGEAWAQNEVFRSYDGELAYEADHPERPLRRYLLYDEDFARDHPAFLRELRRRLPTIHLVEGNGDDVVGEERISRPLREILRRAIEDQEKRE